jgi:hypothetical protein
MLIFGKVEESLAKNGIIKASVSPKDDKLKLEEYFFEVLPNYDEDRVYASDIKKVIQWYNMLQEHGLTDFSVKDDKVEQPEEKQPEKKKEKSEVVAAKKKPAAKKKQ